MSNISLDILAFGAHPDDVEIGMGGTLAKYAREGKRVGICDLTLAELSSNGNVDTRSHEADKASKLLGLEVRENLHLPDRGLVITETYIKKIVTIIRKFKPKLIFTPYYEDRHPDHGNCSRLIEEAAFSAGIRKYVDNEGLGPHKAESIYFYMINGFHRPSFVVDISEVMDIKLQSLRTYESQFSKQSNTIDTPLVNGYIETVEARERLFGKEVGVEYAEGFITKKPLLLSKDLIGE
ncbi:bacillithiol biosynthesis deacetylase BshB1 [Bacillus luteolus]|uniref:Bacillithiol biosynthesis deacetylase BshB1 n=1 Tax=Litchfieldia luteola TaxID=682179 RepID=A0ABR9QP26_9BACI|nr:bacillithiol biosynthesis deacetylase BshB1 [Cytobacillus luteolus]MBE4910260.1 bacillithiol biosynthesis deacetylase BshB1 [Cytobacillus luteolus]MBP1942168.1 bacillithiol biosynthesis deacetylase BshB1 [Cytobacillus luteolus]